MIFDVKTLDAVNQPLLVIDSASYEVETVNLAGRRLLNLADKSMGELSDFIPDREDISGLKSIIAGGSENPDDLEVKVKTSEGQIKTCLASSSPSTPDSNLFILSLVDVSRSKTERVELEKFKSMIENTSEEVYLVDSTGKIVYVNSAAASSLGYTVEEMLELDVEDIDTGYCAHNGKNFRKRFNYLKRHRVPPVERKYIHKKGYKIDKEMQVVYMEIGGEDYICAFGRDISPHIKFENELRHSRRMLRLILDSIPVRVFWKDKNSTYLGCNRAFAQDAGLEDDSQIIGKTDFDLPWFKMAEDYCSDDKEVMANRQEKLNYEEPEIRADGSLSWLRTSKLPLVDGSNKIRGVMGIYEDITAEKKNREKLEKSLDEKETLFREIHHRVKNNLFTIVSLLEMQQMMAQEPGVSEQLAQSIGRIHSMALIHKMIYQNDNFQEIGFGDYLKQLVDNVSQSCLLPDQKIDVEYELEPVTIDIDRALPCGLIVNELVTNAFKHGFKDKKTGKLKVQYGRQNGDFFINIENNGNRLSSDFEIHKSASLGLKLVNSLSEKQLGGRIDVDCNDYVAFQVSFPADSVNGE